jgi:uncharacterized protein YdeI (YjbR/CyaY-like superfamily)
MKTRGTVEDWYRDGRAWREEVSALRGIVLAAGLRETLKWGQPTYTDAGRNIALIAVQKAGAIVSFLKGALLDDPAGLLVVPGENSRHTRYLRFTSLDEIAANRSYLEALLARAVAIERAGERVAPPPDDVAYVEELQQRLAADGALRAAFERLTPGRRRAYNLHFAQARAPRTRAERIERCTERILRGMGLTDCVCGLSRHPPRCDGSHRRRGG